MNFHFLTYLGVRDLFTGGHRTGDLVGNAFTLTAKSVDLFVVFSVIRLRHFNTE